MFVWSSGRDVMAQAIVVGTHNVRLPNLVHLRLRFTFAGQIPPMPTSPSPRRTIALTLLILLALHTVFLLNHVYSGPVPDWLAQADAGLGEHRAVLMILEALAAGVVFVDLITRFDELDKRVRPAHVLLVALAVVGWLAQVFVFFLDSALSLA